MSIGIIKYSCFAGSLVLGYFGPALIFHLALYSGYIEAGEQGNITKQSLDLFFAGTLWAFILFIPLGIAGLFMGPTSQSPQRLFQINLLLSPGIIPCLYAIFALIAYF